MSEILLAPGPWKVGSVLHAAMQKVCTPERRVVQRWTTEPADTNGIEKLYEPVAHMLLKDRGADDAATEYAVAKYKEDTLDGLLKLLRNEQVCDCTASKFHNGISFSHLLNLCDPLTADPTGGVAQREEALQKAVEWCIKLLSDDLYYLATDVWQGFYITKEGFAKMNDQDGIVYLSHFVPWRDHIYNCERDANKVGASKWVVFQDDRNGQYRATAVSDENNRFDSRQLIHEELRGLKSAEILEKIGHTDALTPAETDMVFVHHSGFTCGAPNGEVLQKLVIVSSIEGLAGAAAFNRFQRPGRCWSAVQGSSE